MVFISHAAVDHEIALALKDAITKSFPGVEVFVSSDPEDLAPGDPWIEKILEALKKSLVVLALTTERGLSRKWVWFESGRTWFSEIRLIPCCIGKVRKSALPAPFSSLQALNVDTPSDLKSLFVVLKDISGQTGTYPDFAFLMEELIALDFRAELRQTVQEDPHAAEIRNSIQKKMKQLPPMQRETIRQLLIFGTLLTVAVKKTDWDTGKYSDMNQFRILDAVAGDTGWLASVYRSSNPIEEQQNTYKLHDKLIPYLNEYFQNENTVR